MKLEAEKSHGLSSANQRQRHVSGVVQPESEGLRTRGADGGIYNSRAAKDQCPGSTVSYREQILPSSTFCSFQAHNTLDDARHTGKGNRLYSVCQFKCQSHPETSSQTLKNNMQPNTWATHGPIKSMHKINCPISLVRSWPRAMRN